MSADAAVNDIPDEATLAAASVIHDRIREALDGKWVECNPIAREALKAAAPAIRLAERQRIRRILLMYMAPWVQVGEALRRIDAVIGEPCCDLHGRNCEPPSELCCENCTEQDHPRHGDGSACSAPDLSPNRIGGAS